MAVSGFTQEMFMPGPFPLTRCFTAAAVLGLGLADCRNAVADAFDDHTGYWLSYAIKEIKPVEKLGLRDGLKLKSIGRGITSPCIIVTTNDDNLAKALITWGYRKSADGDKVPVALIEKFVTYRGERRNLTTASGKDVMLFPGFGYNFDIGQVVPKGQGGDIECTEDGSIKATGSAKLFALDGPATPEPEPKKYPDPQSHSGVLPTDFAGTWRVRIDGRWEGRWEIDVEGRQLYGRFISDDTKSVYEISGKVSALPQNAKFNVELAQTDQDFDAYLWTKTKAAMAGTVIMADRKIGFYATRVKEK
jgi:hypothetical protein